MMNADDYAFPFVGGTAGATSNGLSKRDFIAIAAMQGLAANPNPLEPAEIAVKAYEMADALLRASIQGKS